MNLDYIIRHGVEQDIQQIMDLYRSTAAAGGGLARSPEEITLEYIGGFVRHSLAHGMIIVAVLNGIIVGEVHCYTPGIEIFAHVLGNLTIAIHPHYHHQGIGRKIFSTLLHEVETLHPDILRVELVARESNTKAIALYESLGFVIEGRFRKRIPIPGGGFESDLSLAWLRKE
ncbi:MAG TPA: N-acetyltransferase [Bacteroidota bacterium]|nr:N-acetyltransferase [Bacteroidota bacterium]